MASHAYTPARVHWVGRVPCRQAQAWAGVEKRVRIVIIGPRLMRTCLKCRAANLVVGERKAKPPFVRWIEAKLFLPVQVVMAQSILI